MDKKVTTKEWLNGIAKVFIAFIILIANFAACSTCNDAKKLNKETNELKQHTDRTRF